MEDKRCFVEGCVYDAEYECPCSSQNVYFCSQHVVIHLKDSNKTHAMTSIFVESYKGTREAILKFLAKVDSKHRKLKEKVLASFSQRSIEAESELKELIKEINSYSVELSNCAAKISQTQKIKRLEQDPVLGLLSLQPEEAVEKVKKIILPNPDWHNSAKVFCGFSQKIEKMIECFIKDKFESYLDNRLARIENTLEFHDKSICLANNEIANVKESILNIMTENKKSLKEFEDWKETINMKTENEVKWFNSQIASITEDFNHRLNENQSQQVETIMTLQILRQKRAKTINKPNDADSEQEFRFICKTYENNPSAHFSPFTQYYQDYVKIYHQKTSLFNFIMKDSGATLLIYNTETGTKQEKIIQTSQRLDYHSCITQLPSGKLFCFGFGIALIVDDSGEVEMLPSGTPCYSSSAIYFNNNVYCFGGLFPGYLTLSSRFDLDRNEWVGLAPLPQADESCSSIIFNGNILISGKRNINLVRYSIGRNSFTTIPYQFGQLTKILINGERLYLIECPRGSLYESEIGSDTTWRRIADSAINFWPTHIYCSYNKGGIYIGYHNNKGKIDYYKFNFVDKSLTELL